MKALEFCANGDGNPVCPPSKVICRKCMDKISKDMENMITDMKKETLLNKALKEDINGICKKTTIPN